MIKTPIIASALVLALIPLSGVRADLLLNGDFILGTDRVPGSGDGQLANDWIQVNNNGWNNREVSVNGLDPANFHIALGNAGPSDNTISQTVPATAGLMYQLTFEAGSPDAWWNPIGQGRVEFQDSGGSVIGQIAVSVDPYVAFDTPLAWKAYSVSGMAPALTTQARVVLANENPIDGGTMRFDNTALTVVPEPTGLVLLGLGAFLVRMFRRK